MGPCDGRSNSMSDTLGGDGESICSEHLNPTTYILHPNPLVQASRHTSTRPRICLNFEPESPNAYTLNLAGRRGKQ
jgi:hypothetical protein